MSIPVSPAELPEVLARFGSASLISHAAPHVKVHTVDPVVEGEDLVVEPVRESLRANLAADPHVTLVWQPLVRHGWTLIVDGVGRIDQALLASWLPETRDVDAYFLGPKPFMAVVRRGLLALGVPEQQTRFEFFGPAAVLS